MQPELPSTGQPGLSALHAGAASRGADELPVEIAGEVAEQAWFDAPPSSRRVTTVPPPPAVTVGEFLGDELADAWLR